MLLPLNVRFVLILALLLIGLVPPGVGLAQEPVVGQPGELQLSLRQALRIALEKNPGLQQSANQVETSAINVAQRRADFAPDLSLTLSGAERFDKALDSVGGSDSRDYETVSGSLGSSVNLFNGFGDVAALRGAEWELAGQHDTFTREEQTLIFSTVSAFLQSLSDRELIRVRAENLEGNRRQLEQIEALYRAGNRPVSDFYQQQAETSSAELDLLIAERNYAVSQLQLLQTIGLAPTTAATLTAPPLESLETALVARPPETMQSDVLAQRADLLAGEKQLEATREQLSEAQAGYWPALNLATSLDSDYSSLYKRSGFSDQFLDDNPSATIGLTLSVPIFDRQQTRNQVAQARIRQSNARLSLLQQQLQAETELGQAQQDFGTAQKLIGVTEARLTASRQALAAVEERYRVGAATLVELTQARALFVQAGYDRVKARYGLIKQGAAVAYYQGNWERMQTLLAQWETPQ
ncbi:MAG: TolC family protein [Desulfuromonadales bacterium]|nr:TolC family protein [Desulfuromonadales bacterium]